MTRVLPRRWSGSFWVPTIAKYVCITVE
jgi:hypothetical protein